MKPIVRDTAVKTRNDPRMVYIDVSKNSTVLASSKILASSTFLQKDRRAWAARSCGILRYSKKYCLLHTEEPHFHTGSPAAQRDEPQPALLGRAGGCEPGTSARKFHLDIRILPPRWRCRCRSIHDRVVARAWNRRVVRGTVQRGPKLRRLGQLW